MKFPGWKTGVPDTTVVQLFTGQSIKLSALNSNVLLNHFVT